MMVRGKKVPSNIRLSMSSILLNILWPSSYYLYSSHIQVEVGTVTLKCNFDVVKAIFFFKKVTLIKRKALVFLKSNYIVM
jgi:hypothetical protein